jgi:hypothetical protein
MRGWISQAAHRRSKMLPTINLTKKSPEQDPSDAARLSFRDMAISRPGGFRCGRQPVRRNHLTAPIAENWPLQGQCGPNTLS